MTALTITEINNVMVGLFDNLMHPFCNHKSSLAAFSFPDHGVARIKVLHPLKRFLPDCSTSINLLRLSFFECLVRDAGKKPRLLSIVTSLI